MKLILTSIVIVTFCVVSTQAQSKVTRKGTTPCLSVATAQELIQNLRDFREGHPYVSLLPGRFSLLDIPSIKAKYPILYLFYENGFVGLEYNGVHTFSSLTPKGERLESQYSDNRIPLSKLTLISVNKIACTKSKAQVDVLIAAKPTPLAVELLGNAIYQTKPFNTTINHRMEAKRINGKWVMDEMNVIFLE